MAKIQHIHSKIIEKVEEEIKKEREVRSAEFESTLEEVKHLVLAVQEESQDFASFERILDATLKSVGLAACQLFLAQQRCPPKEQKTRNDEGKTFVYKKEKSYPLRCIFGLGTYTSSQYTRGKRFKSRRELALLDSKVGLLSQGGLSPNLALEAVELSTRMPYEHVHALLKRHYAYAPSTRALCGLIDFLGPLAGATLDTLSPLEGDIGIIQIDGRGLPIIRPEEFEKRCQPHQKSKKEDMKRGRKRKAARPRLKPGEKAKKKKQVTVGVLYTLNREEDGKLSGPEQKNYIAQFGSTEIVFQRLRAYLDGLQKFEKLMFMSDGAPHYVTLREQYFPEATAVIDFYHVCEYLWKAGETVFESGSKELGAFISELKGLLLEGKVIEVVASLREKEAELPRRGPGSKGRRKRMKDAIKYIETRQELMPYAQLRLEGLEIGTGVIESAVRQVVAIRFEGPGMRWGAQRPQHLLDLLCLRLSDGWSFFANVLEQWVKEPQARTRMTPLGVNEKSSQDPSSQLKQKEDFPIAA